MEIMEEAAPSHPQEEINTKDARSVALSVIKIITYLFLGGATTIAMAIASIVSYSNSFSSHILLCTFGYVMLMGGGLIACDLYACWSETVQHPRKKLCHFILHTLGSALTIVGTIIRLVDLSNLDGLFSAHGVIGLFALGFTVLTLVVSIVNFFVCAKVSHTVVIKLHAILCMVTIGLGLFAYCLGFAKVDVLIGTYRKNIGITLGSLSLVGIVIISIILSRYNK